MKTGELAIRRREIVAEWRKAGWHAVLRRSGWKLVAGVVAFYLVRDLILYVVLPMGVVAFLR